MIEVDDQILKPANLSNSAVLKALEEEEMEQTYHGYKRVAWPPVSESRRSVVREFTPQPQQQLQPQQQHQQQPVQQPSQGPGHFVQSQPNQYSQEHHRRPSPQPQQPPQPHYTQSVPSYPQDPVKQPTSHVSFAGVSQIPERGPHHPAQQYQSQVPQESHESHLTPATPAESDRNRWAHVRSPVPTRSGYTLQQQQSAPYSPSYPEQQQQIGWNQQNLNRAPSAQHQPSPGPQQYYQQQQQAPAAPHSPYQQQVQGGGHPQYQQQQQQPQYRQSQPPETQYNNIQQQYSPQAYRGESPGIITLRKEAPITQAPSPVYTSQPAAASFRGEDLGGSNMRGDLKWPPPEYKEQAVKENEERRKLALGPVFRPRRVNRDYTQFFAKHALNNYYPTYKVPPGTQHVQCNY